MRQYLGLLEDLLCNTNFCRPYNIISSLFGKFLEFDLSKGFPLLTTKKLHVKSIIEELLWFLSGSTNVKDLQSKGVRIWDLWAKNNGDLGPIYGYQWRKLNVDQINNLLHNLKWEESSRRHILCSWNVDQIHEMQLPPCHCLAQFDVRFGVLSCQVYQRSADVFLGLPFNIASYAFLTHMIAKVCNFEVGKLNFALGNVHLYQIHKQAALEQLQRIPKSLPKLELKTRASIFDYQYDDFIIKDYNPFPSIPAQVVVNA